MKTKEEILNKILSDLPMMELRSEMTTQDWYGWFEEAFNEGLKFSTWIPVSERLPELDGNSQIMCIVYDKYYSEILVRPYNEYHKCWDDEDKDDYYTKAVGGNITHWMPLPPKP